MGVDSYIKLQRDLQDKVFKAQVNFKKSPRSRITVSHIETRLELLEKYWSKFEENHQNIIVESENESDTSSYFKEDIYGIVEDKYIEYKIDLKQALSEMKLVDQSGLSNVMGNGKSGSSAVKLPKIEVKLQEWPELLELRMADPGYGIPSKIDLLLGADVYGQILAEGIIRNPPGTITAQNTIK
ncbi:hypothetical protein MSG28_014513 [Choristoneura fumiferana]|uniref:Uncharacterized protein n=1 Tax=Choristoneura fumiferana TaxID=7141 RepID=A0ACC0JRN8_CHOFU|nr:hypothetical protein MSG28_014513 [Choristoneura fumiferana]